MLVGTKRIIQRVKCKSSLFFIMSLSSNGLCPLPPRGRLHIVHGVDPIGVMPFFYYYFFNFYFFDAFMCARYLIL